MAKLQVKFAEYVPDGSVCKIPLSKGKVAIVDENIYCELLQFRWFTVQSKSCYYAVARKIIGDKVITIRMHRFIADTPADMECHHKNLDPLDNRIENLENLTHADHKIAHCKSPLTR